MLPLFRITTRSDQVLTECCGISCLIICKEFYYGLCIGPGWLAFLKIRIHWAQWRYQKSDAENRGKQKTNSKQIPLQVPSLWKLHSLFFLVFMQALTHLFFFSSLKRDAKHKGALVRGFSKSCGQFSAPFRQIFWDWLSCRCCCTGIPWSLMRACPKTSRETLSVIVDKPPTV